MKVTHWVAAFGLTLCLSFPVAAEESFESVLRKAEEGDAQAQMELGSMYYMGGRMGMDLPKSAHWFRKAAEQGEVTAQSVLASMYQWGWGVPKDHVLAFMWYSVAEAGGDQFSGSSLDDLAAKMTPSEIAEAKRLARERIASQPAKEEHTDSDFANLLQLAEQGSAEAQATVGGAYFYGIGTKRDYSKAAKWLRRAAEQSGYVERARTMAMMGILYKNGLGVPQDKVMAYMWLNLSVAAGQHKAAKERGELANEMTREQIAEAEKMAREWADQHPLE